MPQWTSSCVIYTYSKGGRPVGLCLIENNLSTMAKNIFDTRYASERGRPAGEDDFHARPAYGDEDLPSLDAFWEEDRFEWRQRGIGTTRLRKLAEAGTVTKFRQRTSGKVFEGVVNGPGESVASGPEGQTEHVWYIDSPTLGLAGLVPSDLEILT